MPQATAAGRDPRRRVPSEHYGLEYILWPAPRLAAAGCVQASRMPAQPFPTAVSCQGPPVPTVVRLPADVLADLVLRLELHLIARRVQVLVIVPAVAAACAAVLLVVGGALLRRWSCCAFAERCLQLACAQPRARCLEPAPNKPALGP